jgi:hypothetical protein
MMHRILLQSFGDGIDGKYYPNMRQQTKKNNRYFMQAMDQFDGDDRIREAADPTTHVRKQSLARKFWKK